MIPHKNLAKAVGGKTARACDSCIKKRARWYCAADDAFLCQSCDSSIHSANPLARRHERVRLKIASLKSLDLDRKENVSRASWHGGFTRKARTPRQGKSVFSRCKKEETASNIPIPVVPEVGCDETSNEDNNDEEHLLYRVPIYDPFVAELRTPTGNEADQTVGEDGDGVESKLGVRKQEVDCLHGFLPSDMDLAEFAADVESLLGKGLDEESFGMEELGLADCKEEERGCCLGGIDNGKVKVEDGCGDEEEIELGREQGPPFELSFEYDESGATCTGDEGGEKKSSGGCEYDDGDDEVTDESRKQRKMILLQLDYEAVIAAWASQGSPWTSGDKPSFDSLECWPDFMGSQLNQGYGDNASGMMGHGGMIMGDGGREARVSRYREKRRTRLFSKKIRYEVRKLNAEKRPRMKGRFVKRTAAAFPGSSCSSAAAFSSLLNK